MFRNSPSSQALRAVSVRPVLGAADRDSFARLPTQLHGDHWIAPPTGLLHGLLDPDQNPWFEHGAAQAFLAARGDRVVGRLLAMVDFERQRLQPQTPAEIGLFVCRDDPEAATKLLRAAEDWLQRNAGPLQAVRGPCCFWPFAQRGLQTEGLEHPPSTFASPGAAYYPALLESAGYHPCSQLRSWLLDPKRCPSYAGLQRLAEATATMPGLRLRPLSALTESEQHKLFSLYQRCFQHDPEHGPLTATERDHLLPALLQLAQPELSLLVELDRHPIGFCLTWEDPLRLQQPRLLRRLLRSVRNKKQPAAIPCVALVGLLPEARGAELGGLSHLLACHLIQRAQQLDYPYIEVGPIPDALESLHYLLEFFGATPYKRFTLYHHDLDQPTTPLL